MVVLTQSHEVWAGTGEGLMVVDQAQVRTWAQTTVSSTGVRRWREMRGGEVLNFIVSLLPSNLLPPP